MSKIRNLAGGDAAQILLVGITGGITAASAVIGARLATDPGDVLGFFGSAVGAGLAVIGALWLDQRKDRSKRHLLAASLVTLATTAARVRKLGVPAEAALLTLKQAIHALDTVRQLVPVDDARAALGMSALVFWLSEYSKDIDQTLHELRELKITEAEAHGRFDAKCQRIVLLVEHVFVAPAKWPQEAMKAIKHLKAAVAFKNDEA